MDNMKEFVLLLFLTAASFSDIRYHRIDNGLNLAGGVSGFIFLLSSGDINQIIDGLTAAGLVWIILFVLFMLRLIGAGDIKFLMAASLFTGCTLLFSSLPYMIAAAMLISFPKILKQKSFLDIRFPAAIPISTGLLCALYL